MTHVDWSVVGILYVAVGQSRALSIRSRLHQGALDDCLRVAEQSDHPVRKMYFVQADGRELGALALTKLIHHPKRPC